MPRKPSRKRVPEYVDDVAPDPQPTQRSSSPNRFRNSVARESVFDVFFELGGTQENSRIAHWMFGEGADVNEEEEEELKIVSFREESGSRFRERMDSQGPASIFPSQETISTPRKSFGLFNKKPKTTPRRKSWFRSKSATNLPDTIRVKEVVPPLPIEDDWERLSCVSDVRANPFLGNQIPFPTTPTKRGSVFRLHSPPKLFRGFTSPASPSSFSPPSSNLLERARSHT